MYKNKEGLNKYKNKEGQLEWFGKSHNLHLRAKMWDYMKNKVADMYISNTWRRYQACLKFHKNIVSVT